MTNYFTSASEWLGKVAAEFLEDKQRFGSMDYNFRMIDYSKGYGTKERSCKSIFFSNFRQLLAAQRFWIIDPDPTEWSVRTPGGDGGQDDPSTWRPEYPPGRLVSPSGDQWPGSCTSSPGHTSRGQKTVLCHLYGSTQGFNMSSFFSTIL